VDGIGDGDVPVGRRVAELRRRAGLSQEGLALRLHRSVSWVAKVEQGRRSLDSVRVLIEVADALGVELRDLREDVDPTRPGHAAVPALRRALTSSRPNVEPREPAALRRVHVAHALTLRRRDPDATRQLLAAERLNPEGLPHDTLARSLVAGLVRRDRRRAIPGLRDLARRLRVRD